MFFPFVFANESNQYNLVQWEKAPSDFVDAFKAPLHDIFSNQDHNYERGVLMVVIQMLFL